jgi:hypothetical protein
VGKDKLTKHKSWISQQLRIRSSSNLNLSLGKWRPPPMEDNLKISRVEYLSNHSSNLSQILNLSLGDKTKIKSAWNEDDLNWKTTSKYKKLNMSATDLPQILNLSSGDQTKIKNAWYEDNLQWKTTSNGRRHKSIENWVSQQLLIGSYSNFELKLKGPN